MITRTRKDHDPTFVVASRAGRVCMYSAEQAPNHTEYYLATLDLEVAAWVPKDVIWSHCACGPRPNRNYVKRLPSSEVESPRYAVLKLQHVPICTSRINASAPQAVQQCVTLGVLQKMWPTANRAAKPGRRSRPMRSRRRNEYA